MNNLTEMMTTIGVAIVGVAILAVLVSRKSQTAAIIQNVGSAFSNSLGVAVSPVTGNDYDIQTGYAGSGGLGQFGF